MEFLCPDGQSNSRIGCYYQVFQQVAIHFSVNNIDFRHLNLSREKGSNNKGSVFF